MARTAGDARVRYVAFRLDAPATVAVARQALIDALRATGRRLEGEAFEAVEPWLTRFDGRLGIVRCRHTGVDSTRRILTAIDQVRADGGTVPVRVETLGTSGTIRALVERHIPDLQDTGRRA